MSPREWNATSYDKVAAPMTSRGTALVDGLDLEGHKVVLDAGCGTGQVTAHLRAQWPDVRVIALDGSEDMLRVAADRFAGDDHVSFVHADLSQSLDIEPVCAIVSTSTFHWIPDHDALWHNLFAVLKPGGQLAADFGGAGNCASITAIVGADPWTFEGPKATLRRLHAAGFTDATAELLAKPVRIPEDEFEEYLRTVMLGSHDPNQVNDLIREVVETLPEPVVDYVRLVVHARR
ncbi:MAG: trans-aconitate 2-methyltransferase [Solirubrobacteraceae bacterium]|jgi:trans-aconitate 2-methyltransferase|nr:trans-aconitate 2-methyltransferase [Solirubrobacteraceae bacterium]